MAFNGTWKIDRNENYEKFMEAMGKAYFSNPFCRKNTTPAEYKLKLLELPSGQPVLSLLAVLPLHLFSTYSGAGGEDAEKCSDFNFNVLIFSIFTNSKFISAG